MVDKPLEMAMSQERVITIPGAPEEVLLDAFQREWDRLGGVGANTLAFRAAQISRIYGIGTLACNIVDDGEKSPTNEPLPMENLHKRELAFYVFDPLNTAGSLVLNQDAGAVDFMHPRQIRVGSDSWSNTKALVLMHEQPIWIQWTDSAFGFVGRSVYQRAFYPLKSFVAAMIADNLIQEKLGLLVYKGKTPGSIVDKIALGFASLKRRAIQGAKTSNVVQIGIDEDLASLNLEHVHTAGEYSRNNILKNIATASGMPAALLNEETLTEGFGEGSEDAKQIARYIDRVRIDLKPAYQFLDAITMRRAWNEDFYAQLQKDFPAQYGKLTYEAAFQQWKEAFTATWPNLLSEPDSEKAKGSESRVKAAGEIVDRILPSCDPDNKAKVLDWLAQVANNEKDFFPEPLELDLEALRDYEPPMPQPGDERPAE
ncbi:MAG: hypothetical protein KGL39_45540 [Patescibacteria group bacterium]|nr:hypothetical protein [Patescibacteria group bacterium]